MNDLLGSVWWMIVAIGVLVTFHEFGHYWVARRCGVKVLRFSVGFGRPLWSRRNRHGTEFAIAAIPLGGYVKMLDEREGDVATSELSGAFNRKPVLQRIAIVAAGPIANLLLCVALLWGMFVIGRPDYSATLGQVDGMAASAGFQVGDRFESIDGRPVRTWMDALQILTTAAIDGHDAEVAVVDAAGQPHSRVLPLSRLADGFNQESVGREAGLAWQHQMAPAVVGKTVPGLPADGVLLAGDHITAIDGNRIRSFSEIGPRIQALGERGGSAMIEVDRQGERLALELQPVRRRDNGDGPEYWALGLAPPETAMPAVHDAVQRFGPVAAIPAAFRETGRMAADALGMMRRMLTGHASVKNISGPVTIAQVANATAKRGVAWFLFFLALVSLSLAIINLLPIPVLDGGHLLYYLIELVKGSPLSERSMVAGQYVGLALLAGLMGLAFYNDILRLVS
ncbi:site-2 protease. Metallo peptidase. MEROPS family M50B [Pseudoxanthomonas wuyuanensis]|uniref:Zinc metalloprotease n=1 Tax=Pseudoxanthomonas wuyuanensis TaxID=1073196 RepID=A0A286DFQ7_9GAMM|nr:RIP metalloprotease RseP [Pseudoxanthomonas wuyuanensis]SOD57478.1 site-2 protease. Metallo peptidase. MEROPS family M50B [Pseudoxanthomonas wuyuanensis]